MNLERTTLNIMDTPEGKSAVINIVITGAITAEDYQKILNGYSKFKIEVV